MSTYTPAISVGAREHARILGPALVAGLRPAQVLGNSAYPRGIHPESFAKGWRVALAFDAAQRPQCSCRTDRYGSDTGAKLRHLAMPANARNEHNPATPSKG